MTLKKQKREDYEETLDLLKSVEHWIQKMKDVCYKKIDSG